MLPTPKKTRRVAVRPDTVDAVIEKAKTAVAVRKSVAPTTDSLTMRNLQIVIDNNMREYLPHIPRVIVTSMPFGVFKKRIKEAEVNLNDFVTYMIREWVAIASQSRAAYMKDPAKTRKGSPLPAAPTFIAMAYRMPYFLSAYANSKVTGAPRGAAAIDPKDALIATLRAQLENAQKNAKTMAVAARRRRPQPPDRPEPVHSPIRRPATRDSTSRVDMSSDTWEPPPWES